MCVCVCITNLTGDYMCNFVFIICSLDGSMNSKQEALEFSVVPRYLKWSSNFSCSHQ